MIKNRTKQISKAKIINTGSLFAFFDIDYSYFDVGGVNLANAPQYLNYDLKYVEKYKRAINKGTKVVIVLPDFVFAAGKKQFQTQNDIYYKEFAPWQIEGFRFRKYISVYVHMITSKIKNILSKNVSGEISVPKSEEEKLSEIDNMLVAWKETFDIKSLLSGELSDEQIKNIKQNKNYLRRIIALVNKIGAEVFLVVPPCSKAMNDKISKDCMEAFLFSPIRECAAREHATVLNYLYDERFENLDLYRNGFCLNHKGSKMFTEILINDVGLEV